MPNDIILHSLDQVLLQAPACSCGYFEPHWKLKIYRPKTDIFIEPFSQYKVISFINTKMINKRWSIWEIISIWINKFILLARCSINLIKTIILCSINGPNRFKIGQNRVKNGPNKAIFYLFHLPYCIAYTVLKVIFQNVFIDPR